MKISIIALVIALGLITSCQKKANKKTNLVAMATAKKNKKGLSPSFEMLWQTDSIFKTPESCLFDTERHRIYVSNVNMNPRKKDGNGFISIISKEGKLIKLDWITGLSGPKGMGLYHDTLYVTDVDEIVEIDLNREVISKKHKVEGAKMLNDIAVDPKDGTVYISAMDTHKIYSLKEGKIELWKENINSPNGLLVEGNELLVASLGDGTFKSYNIESKLVVKHFASNLGKADGVVKLTTGNYVVSDWVGEIFLIDNNKAISIYNTKDENLQTADIGIITNEDVILIPTFFGNSVKAYKLNN